MAGGRVRNPGSQAFLDIHYHGDQAAMGGLANPAMPGRGSSKAFLDIHYHGDQAALGGMAGGMGRESGQAEGGLMSSSSTVANVLHGDGGKPGSQAFLDIHYHGDQAAMGGLANPAMPGRGSSQAFLDIHYHGNQTAMGGMIGESGLEGGLMSSPSLRSPRVPSIGPKGGSAALLDIHYHGKSVSEMDVRGKPGLHIGNAALLDIHYHG